MKTTIQNISKAFLILNLFFISNVCVAQANEGFTYQAVIRNSSNALVTNASVGVRISLLENSATGTVLFSERHTATTNVNGLVTFVITDGTFISGSFPAINWGNVAVFLKTDTDPTGGTNYTITTTSQLKSVPFANYANEAGNTWKPTGNFIGSGEFIGSTNDADVRFIRNGGLAGRIGTTSTAFGRGALPNNIGVSNSAFGSLSLGQNSAGSGNVGFGYEALRFNNGNLNTAVGAGSLRDNTGSNNTAVGNASLLISTGDQNTALGWNSLSNLTTGGGNIGIGRLTQVPTPTNSNQLSIGNVIYGTNMGNTVTGTIGIGVAIPTERLEVAGKTKTTNLQVTAGAGINRVLTSDATGNATWQNSNANTGFHVTKNTVQTIVNNTDVKIDFTSEITDDANAFNPTTDEWTIPSNGFYHMYATARFTTNFTANSLVEMSIAVNGNIIKLKRFLIPGTESVDITADLKLVANDKVTILIYQNSGANATLSALPSYVYFSGYKVY